MKSTRLFLVPGLALWATSAMAEAPTIDKADTLWVIVASVLVLLMTPALALFYGGMVRQKNVLSSMMHSFIMMGVVSIVWLFLGYTLAFGKTENGLIGGFEFALGHGISMTAPYPYNDPLGTIPAGAFMIFQMMFAIITPALISGAIAERMKFSGYLLFTILWALLVYSPVACWVWNPGGWLFKKGALDFAGGTVVHLASGASALVACIMLGKRRAVQHKEAILPNNMTTTLLGAGLLWVGWIGFNAGSALSVGDLSLSAFAATHFASAAGMVGWLIFEKLRYGKPTALGAASGLVAGLVGITPGSGFVGPGEAVLIGFLVGAICFFAVSLKHKFGFDDALDVVGVHGVGGLIGAILTGVFASVAVNKAAVEGALATNGGRAGLILTQFVAVGVVLIFAMVMTAIIIKLTQAIVGIRVTSDEESQGLDLALHGEAGYNL